MMEPFFLNPKITVLEAHVLLLTILFLLIVAVSVTMTHIQKKREEKEKEKAHAAPPEKIAADGPWMAH